MRSLRWGFRVLFQLFFVLFIFAANPLFATDYFVSPVGTEAWPNCTTQSSPCGASGTVEDFLGAVAGDTVYFLDGTYTGMTYVNGSFQTPAWNPTNSGTSGNPITFKALNNKGAHIVGLNNQGTPRIPVIGAYLRDYIVWDGFIVSAVDESNNPNIAAIFYWNTNHSEVINCEFRGVSHSFGGSINYEGVRVENSSYVLIENCYVHGYKETSDNHNTSGFKSYGTQFVTIKNSEFSNNTVGVYLKGNGNDYATIRNTWIDSNNIGLLISIKSASTDNLSVVNNVISNSKYINVDIDSNWDTTSIANNMVLHNNTFFGSGPFWGRADIGKGPKVYNNIIYNRGSRWSVLSAREDAGVPLEMDHNSFDLNPSIRIRLNSVSAETYTSLAAWQSSGELYGGTNPGQGSLAAVPLFINSSGTFSELSDFELSVSSPTSGVGRFGSDIGADVSLIGIVGVDVPAGEILPSPALRIVSF